MVLNGEHLISYYLAWIVKENFIVMSKCTENQF